MDPGFLFLNRLSWEGRASKVLEAANALGVFEVLSQESLSAEEVCRRLDADAVMTEKLLIACAAMGLLEKKGEKFENSGLAEKYLVRSSPLYQGDMIRHGEASGEFWFSLAKWVHGGFERHGFSGQEHRNFILAMHNIAMAARVQVFLASVDLSGRKKLFDVGGGPGTYSIEACKRYPELRVVVFDLPETVCITKEFIENEKMSGRVSVRAGSWESDNFGEGNDVVLLSDVMHGVGSGAEMKLKKAYDSMVGGGLLVIQEFLLNDEKSGPLAAAIFNLMVGAYSRKELLDLVSKAGFVNGRVVGGCEEVGAVWVMAEKKQR